MLNDVYLSKVTKNVRQGQGEGRVSAGFRALQDDFAVAVQQHGMLADVTELEIIRRIAASRKVRNSAVRLGIGDDCAVLRVPEGAELAVTTDLCLEGRHFRRDWHTAQSAGHRCLARGLSDLAAMGAQPHAAFLSLALPKGFDTAWLDGFLEGFQTLAARFGVELAGGDTSESPEGWGIFADVVATGSVPQGQALGRVAHGACDVYVTGTLGGAAMELAAMRAARATEHGNAQRRGPQSFPEPRVPVGLALRGIAGSCIDVSDGLSTDLLHLCEVSGCGVLLWENELPIAAGATLEQALHGGEDYELLFTSAGTVPEEIAGVRVTRIGRMMGGPATIEMVRRDGVTQQLAAQGWEHFGGR